MLGVTIFPRQAKSAGNPWIGHRNLEIACGPKQTKSDSERGRRIRRRRAGTLFRVGEPRRGPGRPCGSILRTHEKEWSILFHFCVSSIHATANDDGRRERDIANEEGVNWLRHLGLRWGARNISLACPRCRHPASSPTFRRGRFMLGDEQLVCEECGETSVVTFWRFEGLSCGAESMPRAPLPNSRR